jgi:DNA replication protein DnaC
MPQKLELSKTRLPNKIHPAKVRELADVPPQLWRLIEESCAGRRKWPLFLHGSVGTGKSCSALCLADRVEKAEFWAMPNLATYVMSVKQGREGWNHHGQGGDWTERTWWNYIASVPLLILDDVGLREVHSEFQTETLYLALENREGKPLVCTSNLNPEEILTSYNDRIRSRLCSGTVYELRGRDRRLQEDDFS